jgi:hypothetical protein
MLCSRRTGIGGYQTGGQSLASGLFSRGVSGERGTHLFSEEYDCADFDDWWQFILKTDPTWATGRGDARREWDKRRFKAYGRYQAKKGVALQSQTQKWKAGYRTTPAKWLRGEHEADYVPETKKAAQFERWTCPHEKPCHSRHWCEVVLRQETA